MNQKKDLIKNTIIISIGKFSTKLVSFLLLPLYTSILSKSEYGNFDLLNTISIFLIPIITLQMDEAMFRFLIDAKDENDKRKVFSKTVIFAILSSLVWALIIFLVGTIVGYKYTHWLIFYCISSVVYTIASAFSRGEGNFKLYSFLAFCSSILNILLNILFVAILRIGLNGLFLAYIISSTLVGLYGLYRLKAYRYITFKYKYKGVMREMIKYSLPLVPNSVSWSLISLSNRLIITSQLGIGFNGIYSVSNKFPTIINTCYGFFNTSWRESASKAVKTDSRDSFYKSVYLNLKRFLLGVSIMMIALLPFIFNLLVNKNYNDAYNYIPFMIISIYFTNMASFSSGIFAAYKDTKILAPTTIIGTIISITFNILLINKIGLFAPVFGTMLAYFILYIYRNYKLRKYIVLPKDEYLVSHILTVIVLMWLYFQNSVWWHLLGLVIGTGYTFYINKGFIKEIFNKKNYGFLNRFKKKQD